MSRKSKPKRSVRLGNSEFRLSLKDHRVRDSKGRFISKTKSEKLTYQYYKVDSKGRLRRPNGRFASRSEMKRHDIEHKRVEKRQQRSKQLSDSYGQEHIRQTELEGRLESKFRRDHKEVSPASDFARGKFLKRQYYFNFYCACELDEDSDSPETYIEVIGDRDIKIVEHFFGYATNSYSNMKDLHDRALSAHNQSYRHHTNRLFKLIEKKRAQL